MLSVQIAAWSLLLSGVSGCGAATGPGEARLRADVFMSKRDSTGVAKSEEQVKILPLWLPLGYCLDFYPIHHPYYHLESI